MTIQQWERVKSLFEELSPLDPAQQDERLRTTCSDLPEVRAEVRRLLAAEQNRGSFLDTRGEPQGREPQPVLAAGELLAGRFEIVRFLGRGGMGEVYEARDAQLGGKRVALKTIRRHLADDPGVVQRFTREVLLTREILHPHVCPVFDVGEAQSSAGPIRYLTMKLLEGQTLAARLRERGRLPAGEVLLLARQMAAALEAAHRAGVVHRDFKPGNVMVSGEGRETTAVVTDFGLARSLATEGGRSESSAGGVLVGTPDYMAPEQLECGAITPATDVFAFGVVLYEMITGHRPFGPEASRFSGPPSPRDLVPDLDPAWERALLGCLAPDPSRRWARPGEAVRLLEREPARRTRRRLLAGALAAALALAAVLERDRLRQLLSPLPVEKYVAVLPVTDQAGEPAIADGLLDSLTAELGRLEQFEKRFWVLPAADLRARPVRTPAEAQQAFGANLVFTLTLRRDGPQTRLELRLWDARNGRLLRSGEVVCPSALIFRLPEYAVEEASHMLRVRLPEEIRRVAAGAGTNVAEAYRYYENGRTQLRQYGVAAMDKAIAEFQQAVELDPRYVLAYARLAEAYARKYYQSRAPEALDLARRNAQRATELNRNAAPAWVSAAMASSAGGQYQNALEAYGHALKLDPANVEALFGRALSLSRLGRPAEAEAAYQRVLEVRPNYWRGYNQFGTFYYQNADYVKAEQMFRYAMEAAPAIALPYTNLGGVYLASGKYLEAAAMFRKSLELGPSAEAYANLGTALVFQGQAAEAARMMEKAVEINPRSHVLWRNLGDAYRSAPELRSRAPQAYRQAVALAGQQLQVSPQDASTLMSLSLYWAKLEDASQARKYLEAAGRSPSGDLNLAFKRALVLELIGARERALAELRELAGRGFALDQIRKAPELEELRKDPRFSSVLAAGR